MKTCFSIFFDQADIVLTRVAERPFVPMYPLPFVDELDCQYMVGGTCQFIYRWYDAFDVFIAVLEARLTQHLRVPVFTHLRDLYLVYQLHGHSQFVPDAVQYPGAAPLALPANQRMEVYTPPARAALEVYPDHESDRFALAAVVPKSGWVTRHPPEADSPMEDLIRLLKQRYAAHRYLQPAPITPTMYIWLHMLLSTPAYKGMLLDDALNGPMVRLINEHRSEHRRSERKKNDLDFIEAARLLARQLIQRMDDGIPPTAKTLAEALHTTERRIRATHYLHFNQRFDHYLFACRVEEAKERLQSDLPVSAIAYQLGWKDHANFSHEFKRHTGATPSAYRSQWKSRE